MSSRRDICEVEENKVDFIIIGAAKSGTTWMANMLSQHPNIYIPPKKEIAYFNSFSVGLPNLKNLDNDLPVEWYHRHFKNAVQSQIKGEATPFYFSDIGAAKNIYQYNPDIKLIAVLRNPIVRAFSHYEFIKQIGLIDDSCNFWQAVDKSETIIQWGFYGKHLNRFLQFFPRERILVMLFDDLVTDSKSFLMKIQRFLGVEELIPSNVDDLINITGVPRMKGINRWIVKVSIFLRRHRFNILLRLFRTTRLSEFSFRFILKNVKPYEEKPKLSKGLRNELLNLYKDDINLLEKIIERDLSIWV